MINSLDYEKQQKIEKELYKCSEKDLITLIINKKDLIGEYKDLFGNELIDQMEKKSINQLINIIMQNFEVDDLINNLESSEITPIIKDNFPYPHPRELQLETISKIYNAIENGYKYIILEAVSGFGKSLISATLSNIYSEGKSYILTTTNQLINQYINDFDDSEITKINPRSNFKCKKIGNKNCSAYLCKYSKCKYFNYSDFTIDFDQTFSCNYLFNVKEGLKSNSIICSYDYFLQENFYHSAYFEPRKLLICDEGHNIDDKVSKNISLKFTRNQLRDELKIKIKQERRNILQTEDYYYFILKYKMIYESLLKGKKEGSATYIHYNKRLKDIENFLQYFDRSNYNLIFEVDEYKNWVFRPVKINKMINKALLNYGEVCIFMSSSIFDHENFAYDLGINEEEIYSLRVPNIFDLTNNPIKLFDEFDMSGDPIESGMAKKSLRTIKQILKEHANEKGVIHTTNHDTAKFIKDNIDNYRLITHTQYNREQILEDFKKNKNPLVLVSPSMNEGVDLPGDLCRFQIIFKLPYLTFEDPWINKRKKVYEDGKNWYRYKMITKLIQGYGRGIRYEGDYCKTYILDNRLYEVIYEDLENNETIPKYFINAIENFDEN